LTECVQFQFIETGAIEYVRTNGRLLGAASASEVLTTTIRRGERLSVRAKGLRIGFMLEQDRLRQVVTQHFGIVPPRSINFHSNLPACNPVLRDLRSILCALTHSGENPDNVHGEARAPHEVAAVVALLLGVPSNISDLLDRAGNKVSPAYVLRAQEFMKANVAMPLTVEAIAEAARCTPRNLQLVFRRVLGMSPMRYLRKLRLEEAQRRLLASDRESLTSIAQSLGFTNLGRFARDYRATFGELPSQLTRTSAPGFRPKMSPPPTLGSAMPRIGLITTRGLRRLSSASDVDHR
jgi:AraC-like DNA-binding protein